MKKTVLFFILTLILANFYYGAVSAADGQNDSLKLETNQINLNNSDSNCSVSHSNYSSVEIDKLNTRTSTTGTPFSDIHGYWVNPSATGIDSMDPNAFGKIGITDLFVLTSKEDPEGTLAPFMKKFSGSGIRIHAWVICFKYSNGSWFAPDENPDMVANITNKITSIATNYNVDGIHLDYVRYPGDAYTHENATQNVTSFVQEIYNNITDINSENILGKPKIFLSAALMPECNINSKYYGQDYGELSNYLDFLVPMIYKYNFKAGTTWIGTTTQYIVEHSNGKPVVAGLQTSRDSIETVLPASELLNDIAVAQGNGSAGYVLFRYGLVSGDFLVPSSNTSFTVKQIYTAAGNARNYIESNNVLPNYLLIDGVQINMPQFLSLLVNTVLKVKTNDNSPIVLNYFSLPSSPSEKLKNGNIGKTDYIDLAANIKSFMDTNSAAPNYASIKLGTIGYQSLIYSYSKIMDFYGKNGRLPESVSISSWPPNLIPPVVTATEPAAGATDISLTSVVVITFSKNIQAGANFLGIYIKNLNSGVKVSIASKTISGNTLTIKQTSPRKANTQYQVYIPAGAVKNTAGISLAAPYSYTFKTTPPDTTPPVVTGTVPTNGATGASLTSAVVITFNKDILAGNNYSGIYIKNLASGAIVSMTKIISGDTLTMKQTYNRKSGTWYCVYIPAGAVKDVYGNKLISAYTYKFKTI